MRVFYKDPNTVHRHGLLTRPLVAVPSPAGPGRRVARGAESGPAAAHSAGRAAAPRHGLGPHHVAGANGAPRVPAA